MSQNTDNSRNGHSKKQMHTTYGDMELAIPRDRKGEYEPQLIRKYQNTLTQDMEGKKDVPGVYVGENESAKFWLSIINGLKNRGVEDILTACVDGLNGFPEAIGAVYPVTEIQQCIIHQIRNSTRFVLYKDLRSLMADLKMVYAAPEENTAMDELEKFSGKWNRAPERLG